MYCKFNIIVNDNLYKMYRNDFWNKTYINNSPPKTATIIIVGFISEIIVIHLIKIIIHNNVKFAIHY